MNCGTRGVPDTVAPFRAWRGSRDLVAQSPKFHASAVALNARMQYKSLAHSIVEKMRSKYLGREIPKSLPIDPKDGSSVQFAMIGHGERLFSAAGKDSSQFDMASTLRCNCKPKRSEDFHHVSARESLRLGHVLEVRARVRSWLKWKRQELARSLLDFRPQAPKRWLP